MGRRLGGAHRGVFTISASAGAGQVITLIATPFLSRAYSPEAFGAFAVLLSLATIAAAVGTLRIDAAVPIASEADARNLVKVAAAASLVVALICVPLATAVLSGRGGDAVGLVVPYLVWSTAMYSVLTSYSLRSRNYGAVARRNFLQQAATAASQLLFAVWFRSGIGLTLGLAVGRTVGVGSLIRETHILARPRETRQRIASSLARYWRFPVLFMPSALVNVATAEIPVLLVASRYGADSAGNLSQAMRFGAVPAALVGGAVSSVVMAEIALRVRSGEVDQRSRYLRVSKALAPLGFAWFLVLVFIAPFALPVILGPDWESSGAFAAAIAVAVGAGFVASPLGAVYAVYEKALMNVALDVIRAALVLISGTVAWALGYGPVTAVLAMSAVMAGTYAVSWVVGLRIVSVSSRVEAAYAGGEGP